MATEILPTLAIGFINGNDIRLLNLNQDSVRFESDQTLDGEEYPITISVFDIARYGYVEFSFEHCRVTDCEVKQFSFVYQAELSGLKTENSDEFTHKLEGITRIGSFWSLVKQDQLPIPEELQQSQPIYPIARDKDFYNSYREQEQAWFQFSDTEKTNPGYGRTRDRFEHSFAVNTPQLYRECLETGVARTIANQLERLEITDHQLFLTPFTRLDIGNEFCPNRFPEKELCLQLLEKAEAEGYQTTIALSFVREDYLAGMKEVLEALNSFASQRGLPLEVIVNDWGVLQLVSNHYTSLTPVLGRLLNKRKKDPRHPWKWKVEGYEANMEANNLNSGYFRDYLERYRVTRFEYETHTYKNLIPSGSHSLHYPFYQMTTSTYCPLYYNCAYYEKKIDSLKSCPQFCSEIVYLYPKHLETSGRGNSIFGFNDVLLKDPLLLEEYVRSGIDRLVFSIP